MKPPAIFRIYGFSIFPPYFYLTAHLYKEKINFEIRKRDN
jgi:hypothetical protein